MHTSSFLHEPPRGDEPYKQYAARHGAVRSVADSVVDTLIAHHLSVHLGGVSFEPCLRLTRECQCVLDVNLLSFGGGRGGGGPTSWAKTFHLWHLSTISMRLTLNLHTLVGSH